MSVGGNREGIPESNRLLTRVEPLISIKKLREGIMFGITIKDGSGKEMTDEAYQQFIMNAVAMLETDLDIAIVPKDIVEYKDYRFNDYWEWGYMPLENYPVISLDKLEMIYFRDEAGNDQSIQQIPDSWLRLDAHSGIVRLIPNVRFPSNLQIGASGSFFPYILRSDLVPHLWKATYKAGFKDGMVPTAINLAIGYLAAIQIYIVAGSLVWGAGVANFSNSIDGLSQSLGTTASAENNAFSAEIKLIRSILYGDTVEGSKTSLIGQLRSYWKGEVMGII